MIAVARRADDARKKDTQRRFNRLMYRGTDQQKG